MDDRETLYVVDVLLLDRRKDVVCVCVCRVCIMAFFEALINSCVSSSSYFIFFLSFTAFDAAAPRGVSDTLTAPNSFFFFKVINTNLKGTCF